MYKFILILLLLACTPKMNETDSIRIYTSSGVAIVEGTINGRAAYFILDTGASVVAVDRDQADHYNFTLGQGSTDVSGYGGTTTSSEVQGANIKIGDIDIIETTYAADLRLVAKSIYQNSGIRVSGIIGTPAIRDNALIIDLKGGKLYKR